MRRTPPKKDKEKILKEQEYRCLYCDIQFDTFRFRNGNPFIVKLEWDHQLPFSYYQNNKTENFAASCQVCNRLKHAHIFSTIEEAKIWLADKRKLKGYDF